MDMQQLKRAVAQAALAYVEPQSIIGVGTGSTVNYFIEALRESKTPIKGAVSSSQASGVKLQAVGIPLYDGNALASLDLYVDGADEVDPHKQLIKGGGAALTGEKIVAASARRFICIVDESKQVEVLGKFPLPVEVIPMACAYVAREMTRLGGQPVIRQNVITDHGNLILDVHQLTIIDPISLESRINNIAGVVTVGLFAWRGADVVLVGGTDGIKTIS